MCKRKGRKSVLGKSVLFLIAILSFSGSVMVSEASDVAVAATTGTGGNSAVVSETGTEQTESETESEKKSETEAETEAVKNGWVKDTASGKTYYYKNGQKVTGKTKIEGKYYYFSKNGVMKTGLVTIDSKTYYFKPSNGVMVQSKW
ncbi:MAG: hypothetical protein LUI07_06455, partial [Lachnospiraceae bacterium]|nr:hypothetical protein [Lachnospiraceae bacterium]